MSDTYKILCAKTRGFFSGWETWEIQAKSIEELNEYLEKIALPGCTYEVSKVIVEPVKTVTYDDLLQAKRERLKEENKLKRKKLFEELKAEFEPSVG